MRVCAGNAMRRVSTKRGNVREREWNGTVLRKVGEASRGVLLRILVRAAQQREDRLECSILPTAPAPSGFAFIATPAALLRRRVGRYDSQTASLARA